MPIPLVALGAMGLMTAGYAGSAYSNLYSQSKQRDLYRYQRGGYERQLADWKRNVPGRTIRYPEFSYPGHIRALDTGISQSYSSSFGTVSRSIGQFGGSAAYGRGVARSLYGRSAGLTSRWL